ncbi:MAG: hypothetical protein N4A33_00635 [Bacteriovoracaceae bacterium]|jgi:putative adenylate-forming enzyme|nr:hypothetical protein [Bacteriovoracaceae bacterium]
MVIKILRILISYTKFRYFRSFSSRKALEHFQNNEIKKHMKFLRQYSPYYKKYKNFTDIPIMNKKVMMESFNDIVTVDIKKKEALDIALRAERTRDFSSSLKQIDIGLSSGTSGNRGMFLVSEKEKATWVGTILAKVLPGSILEKQNIALFLRANNNLYETLGSRKINFKFFDLIEKVDTLILSLEEFSPSILVAPSSMLRILAQKVEEGKLSIAPKKVISVAEVLDPLDEKYLERVFKQPIHQLYQCTEGFLGYTCEHGTMHLNEDFIFIEKKFIDKEKKKFFPIITDMARKTQPIVRYELNDILTLKETPCLCGSHLTAIEQIEGREDDIFYFRSKNGELIPIFPDFIRRQVITSSDEIKEYRIVQHDPDSITAYISSDEDLTDLLLDSFDDFCSRKNLERPRIKVLDYTFERSLKKMKRVEQLYEH